MQKMRKIKIPEFSGRQWVLLCACIVLRADRMGGGKTVTPTKTLECLDCGESV